MLRTENRIIIAILFGLLNFLLISPSHAQLSEVCGRLENAYGPFDYTNPIHVRDKLPIVERHHFTPNVDNLIRGETGANPVKDIDYTLRAFPNHHRALYAMVRYQLQNPRPSNAGYYTMECYFDRARSFKPGDAYVSLIYGIYLHKIGNYQKALQTYNQVLAYLPDSAELFYNLGLTYVELKDTDNAVKSAVKAYKLGYPLGGLKSKLKALGVWTSEQDKAIKNK